MVLAVFVVGVLAGIGAIPVTASAKSFVAKSDWPAISDGRYVAYTPMDTSGEVRVLDSRGPMRTVIPCTAPILGSGLLGCAVEGRIIDLATGAEEQADPPSIGGGSYGPYWTAIGRNWLQLSSPGMSGGTDSHAFYNWHTRQWGPREAYDRTGRTIADLDAPGLVRGLCRSVRSNYDQYIARDLTDNWDPMFLSYHAPWLVTERYHHPDNHDGQYITLSRCGRKHQRVLTRCHRSCATISFDGHTAVWAEGANTIRWATTGGKRRQYSSAGLRGPGLRVDGKMTYPPLLVREPARASTHRCTPTPARRTSSTASRSGCPELRSSSSETVLPTPS